MKTITLDAEFANGHGDSHHLKLEHFDPSKTAEEIKASLTKLTKLDLFEKDGVALFKEVLHATVIEKVVTPIFDEREPKKQTPKNPMSVMLEATMGAQPVTEAQPVSKGPVPVTNSEEFLEHVRIPQDLTITETRPEPGYLIQTIELPKGIDPWQLSEEHSLMLLFACMPANATLVNLEVDDRSNPAKLIVTEAIEQDTLSADSPPKKPKRKRKRLLDRIRKRE